MKLHGSILFVKDMPRMLAFYRDGLGLRWIAERSSEDWAELDGDGAVLALHAIPAEISARIAIQSPPEAREDTPIKLVFAADSLVQARQQLIACGAVMSEPSAFGTCDGLDPEGNVFQIKTG
jgi:catechol 2,3-dioxygenase-like lactoylglutathione lyase family enzyme